MRTGDHVFHKPTGETWVVRYVHGDRMAWCGWPPGEALAKDCEIVRACSDEEHANMVDELATNADRVRDRPANIGS